MISNLENTIKTNTNNFLGADFQQFAAARRAARLQKNPVLVKRARKTPVIEKLLAAVSRWNFGKDDKHYAYRVSTIIARFNDREFLKRLCAADIVNHCQGKITRLYQGSPELSSERIYPQIDIDCKNGVGSTAGCRAFAGYLNSKYFAGKLFIEPSTSGNGIHAYFSAYCLGRSAAERNTALDTLQDALRREALAIGADISGLDICGTCPIIKYRWEAGERYMEDYVNGRHAKLPRTLPGREQEFLDIAELTLEHISKIGQDIVVPLIPKITVRRESPQVGYGGVSIPDEYVTPERWQAAQRSAREFLRQLNGGQPITAARRNLVTVDDIAVDHIFQNFVEENPNRDNSLSFAYYGAAYALIAEKVGLDRAFNDRRLTALRNFMSARGLVNWIDQTYYHNSDVAGRKQEPGKACKWRITHQFANWIRGLIYRGGNLSVQAIPLGHGPNLKPVFMHPDSPQFLQYRYHLLVQQTETAMEKLFAA